MPIFALVFFCGVLLAVEISRRTSSGKELPPPAPELDLGDCTEELTCKIISSAKSAGISDREIERYIEKEKEK